GVAFAVLSPKMCLLIVKNLRRNLLRTILTSSAIMVLVLMVTGIVTVLVGLDRYTAEKAKDFKLIIMDRYQVPSQLPSSYADYFNPSLSSCLPEIKKTVSPNDFMTWSFYGGTLEKGDRPTLKNMVFFFVTEPDSVLPMMDDLEDLKPEVIEKLKATKNGCLM